MAELAALAAALALACIVDEDPERVALLEKIAGVRWAKAATGKTDATAVDLYDWAFGLNEQTMAVETDCGTYLHERTMGRIARADGKPAIEKTIKTDTIYAAITFPTDDAYVRVGLRTGWNPQEKSGATDARIIAEARQVLAEVSTAWPGSEGTR